MPLHMFNKRKIYRPKVKKRKIPDSAPFMTKEEGLIRGFHPGYDVLGDVKWIWTGNGWRGTPPDKQKGRP